MPNLTMSEQTPLDQLAKDYGPNGKESRKPCPEQHQFHQVCRLCGNEKNVNTGTTLDTDSPMFKALWKETCLGIEIVPGEWSGCFPDTPDGKMADCPSCHGTGLGHNIRRSRVEAALLLPDAAKKLGYTFQNYTFREDGRVLCELFNDALQFVAEGEADNWLDALAAAILAARKETP